MFDFESGWPSWFGGSSAISVFLGAAMLLALVLVCRLSQKARRAAIFLAKAAGLLIVAAAFLGLVFCLTMFLIDQIGAVEVAVFAGMVAALGPIVWFILRTLFRRK